MKTRTRRWASLAGRWLAAAALAGICACASARPVATTAAGARLSEGVAIGEVTSVSAVFWGRCDRAATLHVRVEGGTSGGYTARVAVTEDTDFTAALALSGLTPNRNVAYLAWCGPELEPPLDAKRLVRGRFIAAPESDDSLTPVRFVWGGDVGGQNACRDAKVGYEIFDRMRARQPAFFVALGDMIYADNPCHARGLFGNAQVRGPAPSTGEVSSFREHWRYNRADAASQRLLESTSMYAVWDDHEITDDAGPLHDEAPYAPGTSRMRPARAAFLQYQPLVRGEKPYRSFRWGQHLEIFLLDTRTYRDANFAADTGETPKSLLGAAQRGWLADAVRRSKATWKIVASSVPLSIPTGNPAQGPDGWANYDSEKGFERELLGLLRRWRDAGVENLIFLSTDVHFATGFVYHPFDRFSFREFISGPLNAGLFPKQDVDETLRPERLFFYGPEDPSKVSGIDQAMHYFNFGEVDIDSEGVLGLRIVNGDGQVAFDATFPPGPTLKER